MRALRVARFGVFRVKRTWDFRIHEKHDERDPRG